MEIQIKEAIEIFKDIDKEISDIIDKKYNVGIRNEKVYRAIKKLEDFEINYILEEIKKDITTDGYNKFLNSIKKDLMTYRIKVNHKNEAYKRRLKDMLENNRIMF